MTSCSGGVDIGQDLPIAEAAVLVEDLLRLDAPFAFPRSEVLREVELLRALWDAIQPPGLLALDGDGVDERAVEPEADRARLAEQRELVLGPALDLAQHGALEAPRRVAT